MEGMRWLAGVLSAALLATGCSVAREASRRPSAPVTPTLPVATAVAPPQAPGLDGAAGAPPPTICTALDRAGLSRRIGATVAARPYAWNDGGVPALDLCALTFGDRVVQVGVTALAAQPNSLNRLSGTLGATADASGELGPGARIGPLGAVFTVGDRALRITTQEGLSHAETLAIAAAARPVVDLARRPARKSDGTCQPAGSVAEQFLGASAQLRRDYRIRGGLTCIWGTVDATVAIVETLGPGKAQLPEAAREPTPRRAPIGDEGYYLPEEGELVFRKGRRVVRVSALADPSRPVSLDRLLDIVTPIMPLFLR
jgi:hypothetical protein